MAFFDLSRVDETDFLFKESLDGMFDFNLVRGRGDAEDVLVELFGEKAGLLCHEDAANDVVWFFHARNRFCGRVSLGGGCQGLRERPW